MDLNAFLKQNTLPPIREEIALSSRFSGKSGEPAVFVLEGITEEENAALRLSCHRREKGGTVLDRERYLKKLAAACVRSPDLKSAELQASWGVMGEEDLLAKMLTAGEFARLLEAVERVCGFTSFTERKAALKKASAGETAN